MHKGVWFLSLLGLGAVLALGVALLWLALGSEGLTPPQPAQEVVSWTGLASPTALEDAGRRGLERARQWAPDAFLVWVKGSWQPNGEWAQATFPPIAWSLYYYSPAKAEVASAAVRGDELFWTPPTASSETFDELLPFPPPYGVDVAWVSFRGAGGDAFLQQHPAATVQYRLRTEAGQLTWVIVGVEGDASFQVKVDAISGLVVP